MSDASVNERLDQLRFYQTPEHECSYLNDRMASTIFVDPTAIINTEIYSQLALIGFRRSGRYLYRPRCSNCSACIPIRIPVDRFKPSRSQKRVWKKNRDIEMTIVESGFRQEHYDLYECYLKSRHPDGGMDDTTPEKYRNFLLSEWMETCFIEFRLDGKLVAIAVTDVMTNSLSALYTYFDPGLSSRSLGVFAILWQIEHARNSDLRWLYLGYWIEQSEKMSYKTRYCPYELHIEGQWKRFQQDASQP